MPLQDLLLMLLVFGGGFWVLRPLALALADRMRARGAAAGPDLVAPLREELLAELQQMRNELAELAERVDFAERLLAKQRESERLAPPR